MTDVTVITPVFNTQDYLHRCIKSVLEQKHVDIEFILIDDGSTDNSTRIIEHYQKSDSRVLSIKQNNKGQGPARNLGLRLATSEFVCFVDSDDYLGRNTLSKLTTNARKLSLDVCSPNIPMHYFTKSLELIACLPNKAQFFKREIVEKFQIEQPDVRSGQDGVFSHLLLSHCKRIGMVKDAEYIYTHARPGSTFQGYLKRHDLVPTMVKEHLDFITSHYDKWQLWEKNSDRLLSFILDETLRNRLLPHYESMTINQRAECLSSIMKVVERCLLKSQIITRDTNPVIAMFEDWSMDPVGAATHFKKDDYCTDQLVIGGYNNENFDIGEVYVSKYTYKSMGPGWFNAEVVSGKRTAGNQFQKGKVENGVAIANKVDFVLNSLNNIVAMGMFSSWYGVPSLDGGEKQLIVNLTALPHRLPSLHLVLASIFVQTKKPSKIVLWLPDSIDVSSQIPAETAYYLDKGLEIRSVKDVGPHTKLLYALKEFPNDRLITIDDDIVYPVNMIQALLAGGEKYPKAIIANWARELAFGPDGVVLGVRKGRLLTPPTLESDIEQASDFEHVPSSKAFPYGTSGVLYPPGCMDEMVFDIEMFQRLCPKEDDIWFKACSLRRGVKVVATNLGINPKHHCLPGSQEISLRHFNHGEDKNEIQMQNVFKELSLYKKIDLV